MVNLSYEKDLWSGGSEFVAGVDEAGRGPLAGPVVAAAVIMPHNAMIEGVDDSKKLSSQNREKFAKLIVETAVGIGVGIVGHRIIDEINIYRAAMRAMEEAVADLRVAPHHLLVDGPRYECKKIPFTAIVEGDAKCFSIAAASIIAKVTRDRLMIEYDAKYPQYGFAKHKGYGTKEHLEAIRIYGPCEIHRRSFKMPAGGGRHENG
jgi:ribonuclease HII